jgi:hypothetical protein
MRFLFFLPLLFLSPLVHAELKWEKTVQRFQRVPDDKALEARYPFRNIGSAPLTIKSLRSSCGCTTAKLDKKTYAPGEQGEVVLRFTFGDRKGALLKGVTVTTDEKGAEPVVLKLIVDIHDPVTVAPGLVFWRIGEAATAKTVQLSAEAAQPVRIKSVVSSSPNFTATLQTVQPGLQYAVAIVPSATAQKGTAEITVQTDFPTDAPHAYTIYARIK